MDSAYKIMSLFLFHILFVLLPSAAPHNFLLVGASRHYNFVVREVPYTRLCSTKKILTVNGQFPGPPLYAHKGDTVYITVYNRDRYNITIHWHGVKQPRNPWADGPEYVTQCPIMPGDKFTYKVIFSTEEGTLWWHAHSDWSRATVHGAIFIYPKHGTTYPFNIPEEEVPIILGEWWRKDVNQVLELGLRTGGDFNVSDAFTINGQPGDLYPCSQQDTFRLKVEQGKKYLLRIVNAAMNNILFLAIAKHNLTVVGVDGSYTKALSSAYITIAPGQTVDAILEANQGSGRYYMAARSYTSNNNITFDNTTTTAIIEYTPSTSPVLPPLPYYNDTQAAMKFLNALRSLADSDHQTVVPINIHTRIVSTISINAFPCPNNSCAGPNGTRLAASMNNISFHQPSIDILEAYYKHIGGVYETNFPTFPPLVYNFTSDDLPLAFEVPTPGTKVKLLPYNSTVEVVFQNTNLVAGLDHPMHLHGHSFYVVGSGLGNFDQENDPKNYNLVDPVFRNTVVVPRNGWATIRFNAANPGVWFLHCHFERHLTWGMDTVFITRNGSAANETILPPPFHMPPCVRKPQTQWT